jgi:hypothetical protein
VEFLSAQVNVPAATFRQPSVQFFGASSGAIRSLFEVSEASRAFTSSNSLVETCTRFCRRHLGDRVRQLFATADPLVHAVD